MVYFMLSELLLPGETGRVTFSTELTSPVVCEDGQPPTTDFGAHVLEVLAGYGLFTHHFERNKASLEELEIEAEAEEGTPYHDVSFNTAKMVRLPGLNPAAELQELRELFHLAPRSIRRKPFSNLGRETRSQKKHRETLHIHFVG
jgi:hypothetical protein